MKIGYHWLKEYVTFELTPQELGDRLTAIGTAVEDISPVYELFTQVLVGRIESDDPHPSRSDLRLLTLDIGERQLSVVCGAPNTRPGLFVPVALPGAKLPGGQQVGIAEISGVSSPGFCCSELELGLSEDGAKLMELDMESFDVGDDLWRALNLEDWILSFELTPNRPDCLSALGIAREIATLVGSNVKRPEISSIGQVAGAGEGEITIVIDDGDGCPRYAAQVLTGGHVGPSPFWLKRRLKSAGIRSISNAVDITNFVMLETGQPLHAFDLRAFDTGQVVVRRAHDGEAFQTLDDVERRMPTDAVMVTNGERAVAVGGIMGGQESEVSTATTGFLIESAYFNPSRIRRARTKIGLQTDAAHRFERGTDPNGVSYALARAVNLFEQLTGATVSRFLLDCYPNPIEPTKLDLRPERVNDILGTRISTPTMIDYLSSLEFGVAPGKTITVTVPTFRPDCTREIDIIEEIARIHGYEEIPTARIAGGAIPTAIPAPVRAASRIRELLVGMGLSEIITSSFYDPSRQLRTQVKAIGLKNPLTEDLTILRADLLSPMLSVIAHNLNRQVDSMSLFEWGRVFASVDDGEDYEEHIELSLGLCGRSSFRGWDMQERPFDFFDLKGMLENLMAMLGQTCRLEPGGDGPFEKGQGYSIVFGKLPVGTAGLVSGKVLERFDVREPVWAATLDSRPLMDFDLGKNSAKPYSTVPRFPASQRDLAIIVDTGTAAGKIEESIRQTGGELLESVRLFDLYTGKQIPNGKKSLAFSLVFRRMDRTVEDSEVDAIHAAICGRLRDRFGAELRS